MNANPSTASRLNRTPLAGSRRRACALFVVAALALNGVCADTEALRRDMVERAVQYLFSIQKDGMVGESRENMVTASFALACMSSGILPTDPVRGHRVTDACAWVLKNSSTAFLGGREEPNADHAVASLMLTEVIGAAPGAAERRQLYERATLAVDHALRIQDKGVGAEYYGGWRRNDETRVNDRMLTVWYLTLLRSAGLRGLPVPKAATGRATEFMAASQKLRATDKPDERGGFSIDASGLPVRSATAAGMAALILFDPENEEALAAAADWLVRHPARWHGPSFYETNFFAVRALYRHRNRDGGQAFERYFSRLVRILKERQDADGSFPFPPGHGGPTLAMGNGYSTAMAVLILNVDRGLLPVDK